MNENFAAKMKLLPLILVLHLGLLPGVEAKPKTNSLGSLQFVYEVPAGGAPQIPYNHFDALRSWLATQENSPGFPKEFHLDLNGDGAPEAFLRVVTHAHFAEYSIFTRRGVRWVYMGSSDYSSPPVRLARSHAGWHDIAVDIEGSRNRLDRRYFRYDPGGRSYDFSYNISLRPMEHTDP